MSDDANEHIRDCNSDLSNWCFAFISLQTTQSECKNRGSSKFNRVALAAMIASIRRGEASRRISRDNADRVDTNQLIG